jgi:hypothetical protein
VTQVLIVPTSQGQRASLAGKANHVESHILTCLIPKTDRRVHEHGLTVEELVTALTRSITAVGGHPGTIIVSATLESRRQPSCRSTFSVGFEGGLSRRWVELSRPSVTSRTR